LTKKFTEISDLLKINSSEFKEWTIERMDANMKKIIEVLDKVNDEEKLNCLRAFTQSLNLVEWLRKEAKSLSELKVLVDMASMTSVGANEQVLDKTIFAKTLKEAGSAFASLIYELKTDHGFYQFIELCEKVFSHLQTDKQIAKKLLEVKDKVPMLEEIKKRRGQVESSALNDVKLLNDFGVYKIEIPLEFKNRNFSSKLSNQVEEFEKELQISNLITLSMEKTNNKGNNFNFKKISDF
jgi:hypothetical protein